MQVEANDNLSQPIEDQISALDRLISFHGRHSLPESGSVSVISNGDNVVINPQSGGNWIINAPSVSVPAGQGLLQQVPNRSSYRMVNSWEELMRDDEPAGNEFVLHTGLQGMREFDQAMKQYAADLGRKEGIGFFELITLIN